MSILNVNQIQPVGGGNTITVNASDVSASGVTITASSFVGPVTGNVTGGTVAGSTGTFTGDVSIADKIIHTGDTDTAIRFPAVDTITAETAGSERLRIDSSGRLQIGASNNSGANTKLVVGAGNNINTTAIINTGDVDVDALTLSNWDGSTTTNKVTIHFDSSGIGGWNIGMPAATDAFVIEDDGGSERLRIDSSGRLLVGTSSSVVDAGKFQVKTQYNGALNQQGVTFLHGAFTPANTFNINLARSRDNFGGDSTVINGTRLGQINFKGYDGTDYESSGAAIYAEVDGTPGSNDMPGRLTFSTTADGSASPTERLRILSDGTVATGGLSATPGTVAAGSYIQAAANAGFFNNGYDGKFGTSSNHPVYFQVNGTSKASITSAGNLSITDGNLVVASGHGIDFSASGNTGGMQSELLDDYEEGIWTPTLIGSSSNPSVSFSTQAGAYEKIGALVHASFFMAVSGVSSQGSGQLRIGGLPFNASSNINASEVPAVLLQSEPFTDGDGSNRAQFARTAAGNFLICGYRELTTGNCPVPGNAAANVGTGYFIGHITYRTLS